MMNINTQKKPPIGYSMRRLRNALENITSSSSAEKIAFHLAELKPELSQLFDLLNKVEQQQSVTPSAINTIMYFFEVHWPYHMGKLQKLMKRRCIVRFAESARIAPSNPARRRPGAALTVTERGHTQVKSRKAMEAKE